MVGWLKKLENCQPIFVKQLNFFKDPVTSKQKRIFFEEKLGLSLFLTNPPPTLIFSLSLLQQSWYKTKAQSNLKNILLRFFFVFYDIIGNFKNKKNKIVDQKNFNCLQTCSILFLVFFPAKRVSNFSWKFSNNIPFFLQNVFRQYISCLV